MPKTGKEFISHEKKHVDHRFLVVPNFGTIREGGKMSRKKIMSACAVFGVLCCLIAGYLVFGSGKQEKADIQVTDVLISAGDELPDLTEDIKQSDSVSNVMVDASEVDTSKPGEYPITYYYADADGNQYAKSVTCTVENTDTETLPESVTEE